MLHVDEGLIIYGARRYREENNAAKLFFSFGLTKNSRSLLFF